MVPRRCVDDPSMSAEPPFLRVKTPNLDFIPCATVLQLIFNRFWADLGWPLDPKIFQNCVRGVRNQTLRIYTLDVDPMSFRTESLTQYGSKMVPKCPQGAPSAIRRSVSKPFLRVKAPNRDFIACGTILGSIFGRF